MRILYTDDDDIQLDVVRRWLTESAHTVIACTSGAEAIAAIERDSFDIAILDLVMPDVSGEDVLQWIRKRGHGIPVLFTSAKGEEEDIVHILDLGADDYLVKPLRQREMLARVHALVRRARRTAGVTDEVIELGPYRIHPHTQSLWLNGELVKMTRRMRAIAVLLFANRNEVVSRARIYEEIWGVRQAPETRSVDTHVSRVRAVLELDGRHGWRLSSVYHHGYRLDEIPR